MIAVRVAILVLAASGSSGCAALRGGLEAFPGPTASLDAARIDALSMRALTMAFDVSVENPYDLPLPIVSMDYALSHDGAALFSGEAPIEGVVPAHGKKTVTLPLVVDLVELVTTFSSLRPGMVVDYAATLGLSVTAPVAGALRLPLTHEGSFPVPRAPTLAATAFRVEDLSATRTWTTIELEISNPNDFGFDLAEIGYRFSLRESTLSAGRTRAPATIPPGRSAYVPFSTLLDTGQLAPLLITSLGDGRVPYELVGALSVTTEFGPVDLTYEARGEVPIFR